MAYTEIVDYKRLYRTFDLFTADFILGYNGVWLAKLTSAIGHDLLTSRANWLHAAKSVLLRNGIGRTQGTLSILRKPITRFASRIFASYPISCYLHVLVT